MRSGHMIAEMSDCGHENDGNEETVDSGLRRAGHHRGNGTYGVVGTLGVISSPSVEGRLEIEADRGAQTKLAFLGFAKAEFDGVSRSTGLTE